MLVEGRMLNYFSCVFVLLVTAHTAALILQCDTTLELNLSSVILHVSLLSYCLFAPCGISHNSVCTVSLQASVMFGQLSEQDLELRSEKNAGETQTVIK